jgi:NAD-dependent deacetylase
LALTSPNSAHELLAKFEVDLRGAGVGFSLITQNVDDLHARAGSAPIHIHGELSVLRCEVCGEKVRDLDHLDPEVFFPCPACGHKAMRPDVVWFGEMPYRVEDVFRQVGNATVFLSSGTSGVVYPAAGFLQLARDAGAKTFVNSLDEPENLSLDDAFFAGKASEVLPELCVRILKRVTG